MKFFSFFMLIFPPVFGLALTFFPIHTLYVIYRIVEFIDRAFGNIFGENLKLRYKNLGKNPKAYEQAHPFYGIYCRIIGVLILITYVWILTLQ